MTADQENEPLINRSDPKIETERRNNTDPNLSGPFSDDHAAHLDAQALCRANPSPTPKNGKCNNDNHYNNDQDRMTRDEQPSATASAAPTEALPPYQAMAPPSIPAGAFHIRIKAQQLPSKFPLLGRLLGPLATKFNEPMLISPNMTLPEFERAFGQRAAAYHKIKKYTQPFHRTNERVHVKVEASWVVEEAMPMYTSKTYVHVTLQNWPDVVARFRSPMFRKLKVYYWIEPVGGTGEGRSEAAQ